MNNREDNREDNRGTNRKDSREGSSVASFFVHESSYVDDDVVIGEGTKLWHFCHVQSGARIGRDCSFGQNVNIASNVVIGNGCRVQNNVSIYEGVTLEDGVFCGPSCVFTNDLIPRAQFPSGRAGYLSTVVKEGASIGANATIVCGHDVGKSALVAAGAVVTHDVDDFALVAGVPACRIGWVCVCGQRLDEHGELLEGLVTCSKCGRAYLLENDRLRLVE